MQHYPIHAEGTSFVQPNEALGTFKQAFPVAQKGQDPFPPNGRRIVGGGWRKSPAPPLRQRGRSRGGSRIFTINDHGEGQPPPIHDNREKPISPDF